MSKELEFLNVKCENLDDFSCIEMLDDFSCIEMLDDFSCIEID